MDTVLHGKALGLQARSLKNKLVDDILEIEARGGTIQDLAPLIMGERISKAWDTGNVDDAAMQVGQSIGLMHDIPSCKELLDRMIKEAEEQIDCIKKMCQ
jgi:nitronate monooxygenase